MEIYINGTRTKTLPEKTILAACTDAGVTLPTLCHHPDIAPQGVCGICIVEADGKEVKSCETPVKQGMKIFTHTDSIVEKRKNILREILKDHPNDCLTCEKGNGDCELQNLCYEYEVPNRNKPSDESFPQPEPMDKTTFGMVRDMSKCILCETCVAICRDVQKLSVYETITTETGKKIVIRDGKTLEESGCIACGQCLKACPVGALYEKNDLRTLNRMLRSKEKHFVVQTAPAIKHILGEAFGIEPGEDISGKMLTALRQLGFNGIFSTDFSADVTIMEEGTELLDRIKKGEKLPMFTSCCPGWINYAEKHCPDLLGNISSCKSPQQMFGALSKSYYPKLEGIDEKDVYGVAIMPCIAKKEEIERSSMARNGIRDVDMVLTAREFAKLIKLNRIDFRHLPESGYDQFLGLGSGAARIFATSGGVMEAALRTVVFTLTGEETKPLEFKDLRGFDGVKEAAVTVGDLEIRVAVVNGIGNIPSLVEQVRNGTCPYHFIEVMACAGGCINGGGAPVSSRRDAVAKRAQGLYSSDRNNGLKRSYENPEVAKLYGNYLGKPGEAKSHSLLHTHYAPRNQ
ncbi:MAG: 2Fe-2S iron-sulfur cluster binding domain-containing protein [Desulfobacteraceae bacterium]|nr:2Fe-2S iron-sulfur cluster binding domain-containing protein [Desulfobacteraceae bacterium]